MTNGSTGTSQPNSTEKRAPIEIAVGTTQGLIGELEGMIGSLEHKIDSILTPVEIEEAPTAVEEKPQRSALLIQVDSQNYAIRRMMRRVDEIITRVEV